MRKILAALLAVMMIAGVFATLPLSAEDAATTTIATIDGTKSNELFKDLIITEILVNSKSGTDRDDQTSGESAAVFSSPDAMDYIEVYNASDKPVNIYDYVILSAPYRDFTGESKESGSNTNTIPYKFTYKNVIVAGDIHTEGGAKSDPKTYNNQCVNPAVGVGNEINPGETAVIWYWTAATDTACSDKGYSLGQTDAEGRTFAYFRDYYGMDKDTKIFVTNAKASAATNSQTGGDWFQSLEYNYIYALAHKNYDADQPAINVTKDKNNNEVRTLTDTAQKNLRCFAAYTQYNSVGIVNTQNMDDVSAYYVPATCTPDLINQNNQKVAEWEKVEYTPFLDYVHAGCAFSYRETAIISFVEEPTPGGMPSWQWQYIEQGSSLDHDPESDKFGYGLAYIDSVVWNRVEEKVEDMVNPENLNKKIPGITGVANQLTGTAMDEAAQAAKKKELYDQLMDAYVCDWLNSLGQPANTKIVGENGRLNTEQTVAGTYDWVALADAYMKDYYSATIGTGGNYGYTESKKDYAGYLKWLREYYNPIYRFPKMSHPIFRIHSTSGKWEISYDQGRNWTTLDVSATQTGGAVPEVRADEATDCWEISYDGKNWISLGVNVNGSGGGEGSTNTGGSNTGGTNTGSNDTVSGNGGSNDADADKNANADQSNSLSGGTIALIVIGSVLIVVVLVVIVLLIIIIRSRGSDVGEPSVSASKDEYFDNAAVPVLIDISRVMDLAECLRESWAMCKRHPMPTNIAHSMQMIRELHRTIETTSQKDQALNALAPIETMLQMLQSRTELFNDAVAFPSTAASVDGMIENLIEILTALYGEV